MSILPGLGAIISVAYSEYLDVSNPARSRETHGSRTSCGYQVSCCNDYDDKMAADLLAKNS